mmetsp:Transcript_17725/g.35999  ORF Transcript_17725/g.35999 Transcript_17725/m.35999 type:complete len:235 (+) Transcript_17725:64-768(+)
MPVQLSYQRADIWHIICAFLAYCKNDCTVISRGSDRGKKGKTKIFGQTLEIHAKTLRRLDVVCAARATVSTPSAFATVSHHKGNRAEVFSPPRLQTSRTRVAPDSLSPPFSSSTPKVRCVLPRPSGQSDSKRSRSLGIFLRRLAPGDRETEPPFPLFPFNACGDDEGPPPPPPLTPCRRRNGATEKKQLASAKRGTRSTGPEKLWRMTGTSNAFGDADLQPLLDAVSSCCDSLC